MAANMTIGKVSRPTLEDKHIGAIIIGVNRPAIVREIPYFGFFPAFPHFCKNVPHFWLYFETTKIVENRNNLVARRHLGLVRKRSAQTSMIAAPS